MSSSVGRDDPTGLGSVQEWSSGVGVGSSIDRVTWRKNSSIRALVQRLWTDHCLVGWLMSAA